MAKAQPKKSSSIKWLVIVGGLAIAYLVLSPSDDPKATAKTSTASKKKKVELAFTQADYDAAQHPFDPLNGPVVDAFKPAVIRNTTGGGVVNPTGVPGDPGWSYSGMAVVNGVQQGLLENGATGESVFLLRGDTWQNKKVSAVYADYLVLIGPNGPIKVMVDEKETPSSPPVAGGSNTLPAPSMPVMPLRGDIGDPSLNIVQDNTGTGTGTGNSRRRRRNAG